MQKIFSSYCFYLLGISLVFYSCVEPIDINETVNFKQAIVIEATITNEFKQQEIKLSKSYNFEGNPEAETNAQVQIIDDNQHTYNFEEKEPGKYFSLEQFSAQPNRIYQLSIVTSQGKKYLSKKNQLPNISKIDKITAAKEIDNFGNKAVSILIDSYNPNNNSKYYRYEYEETYKIIAPKWTLFDLKYNNSHIVEFKPKTEEERVCYNTIKSNSIIQTTSTNLSEDRITDFKVRTLYIDNPIIAHRYSILVKQFVQSLEAYSYYETLGKISSTNNIFSNSQPGFIQGNVFSVDDAKELVIGYFDISSVSTKRLFFNFRDIYPDESLPPYFIDCELFAPSIFRIPGEISLLEELINNGEVKYFSVNPNYPDPTDLNAGPYYVVEAPCGDCTKIGSNIVPDFWVE